MRSLRVLFLPRGGVERVGGGARAACDHCPAPPRAAPAAARWRPRMRAYHSPGAGKGGGDWAGGCAQKGSRARCRCGDNPAGPLAGTACAQKGSRARCRCPAIRMRTPLGTGGIRRPKLNTAARPQAHAGAAAERHARRRRGRPPGGDSAACHEGRLDVFPNTGAAVRGRRADRRPARRCGGMACTSRGGQTWGGKGRPPAACEDNP